MSCIKTTYIIYKLATWQHLCLIITASICQRYLITVLDYVFKNFFSVSQSALYVQNCCKGHPKNIGNGTFGSAPSQKPFNGST